MELHSHTYMEKGEVVYIIEIKLLGGSFQLPGKNLPEGKNYIIQLPLASNIVSSK